MDEIQSFPQFFDMTTLEEEKFKKYVICGGIEKSSNLFLIKVYWFYYNNSYLIKFSKEFTLKYVKKSLLRKKSQIYLH